MDKFSKINHLIDNALEYLRSNLLLRASTIARYNRDWRKVKIFMQENNQDEYNRSVEDAVMRSYFHEKPFRDFKRGEKRFFYSLKALTQFYETNTIKATHRPDVRPLNFTGRIGSIFMGFIEFRAADSGFSLTTRLRYERLLFGFLQFCTEKNVKVIEDLNPAIILKFIQDTKPKDHQIFDILRGLMRYLFVEKILSVDYSKRVPKFRMITQPRLAASYSEQEIVTLINAIDRSSTTGKRDYAVLLLAATTGLRAGDIASLKFENINWGSQKISITQLKTCEPIVTHLTTAVCNALQDYILHSRPKSMEPYIFLTAKPPYSRFVNGCSISTLFRKSFRKAKINVDGKRYGAHSLRHSFAQRLLEKGTSIRTIAGALGQINSNSSMIYIRIDFESMKICTLDVPLTQTDFYEQKGGIFYE